MTGGVRPGGVAGAVAAGGGVAAGAARQSGADAISPSAARLKRLELCFTNIGPPMFLEAISRSPRIRPRRELRCMKAAW